jgi:hypothetical protein
MDQVSWHHNIFFSIPTTKDELIAYLVFAVVIALGFAIFWGHDLPPKEF